MKKKSSKPYKYDRFRILKQITATTSSYRRNDITYTCSENHKNRAPKKTTESLILTLPRPRFPKLRNKTTFPRQNKRRPSLPPPSPE